MRIKFVLMVFGNVVRVLQKMSSQHGYNTLVWTDHAIFDQPLDARDSGCRRWFAADAVAPDDCFSVRDLRFGNAQNPPASLGHGTQGFLPRHRRADLDCRRQCLRMPDWRKG